MTKQEKYIFGTFLLAAFCLGVVCQRYFLIMSYDLPQPKTVTKTVVRVDTITKIKEVPVDRWRTRVEKDTLFLADSSASVPVLVPIDKYVFKDNDYRAEISGYKVSLDKMQVFPKTVTEYKETQTFVPQKIKPKFSLGLQVGYGVYLDKQPKFAPYLGLGVQYNFISF